MRHPSKIKEFGMRNDSFPLRDPIGMDIFLVMARALAPAPFQPDFRARWDRVEPANRRSFPPEPAVADSASKSVTPQAQRKGGLLERLDRWFWAQQQRDLEAYLAQSADIHDLEQRMRNVERGSWHRYN
jgi:hypothetical protein